MREIEGAGGTGGLAEYMLPKKGSFITSPISTKDNMKGRIRKARSRGSVSDNPKQGYRSFWRMKSFFIEMAGITHPLMKRKQ